ncbi:MAG: HhH-GPD-type base excision DNA repair protein [Acidimicrobiales bacterium]
MLHLSQDPDADRLLTEDPLALLIGMVLDQQIPLERAFRSPLDLRQRLGADLDAGRLSATDPEELASVFAQPPALHRFPGSMAGRVQDLCRTLVEDYAGQATAVWGTAASGRELVARIKALPGFGEQKAKIFTALLGKQMGVTPAGWREATAPFGEPGTHLSVADIEGLDSLARVREHKAAMKAAAKAAAASRSGGGVSGAAVAAAKRAPAPTRD